MSILYYLQLRLRFPEGVHFGAGKRFSSLDIARDGRGRAVLSGTSLAGFLRHAWRSRHPDKLQKREATRMFFGEALDRRNDDQFEDDIESRVRVTNYVIDTGQRDGISGDGEAAARTHHLRNRHRGTVIKSALFAVNACPPGSRACVGLWIQARDLTVQQVESFVGCILQTMRTGTAMGGNSNRGIGRVELDESDTLFLRFDRTKVADHAAYLTAHRAWRAAGGNIATIDRAMLGGEVLALPQPHCSAQPRFEVELELSIPRGQDVLIAQTHPGDGTPAPHSVISADGQRHWLMPGSTLRGIFRSWFHRLAARDDADWALADTADAFTNRECQGTYTSDRLSRSFRDSDTDAVNCPIVNLFGDTYTPGRIHITDGLVASSHIELENCCEMRLRTHVAVDRITGGAAKGRLFSNHVLTNPGDGLPRFVVRVAIESPQRHELKWLAKTLVALHIGLLRVGSSKSSGRLEMTALRNIVGDFENAFGDEIQPLQTMLDNVTYIGGGE